MRRRMRAVWRARRHAVWGAAGRQRSAQLRERVFSGIWLDHGLARCVARVRRVRWGLRRPMFLDGRIAFGLMVPPVVTGRWLRVRRRRRRRVKLWLLVVVRRKRRWMLVVRIPGARRSRRRVRVWWRLRLRGVLGSRRGMVRNMGAGW